MGLGEPSELSLRATTPDDTGSFVCLVLFQRDNVVRTEETLGGPSGRYERGGEPGTVRPDLRVGAKVTSALSRAFREP